MLRGQSLELALFVRQRSTEGQRGVRDGQAMLRPVKARIHERPGRTLT